MSVVDLFVSQHKNGDHIIQCLPVECRPGGTTWQLFFDAASELNEGRLISAKKKSYNYVNADLWYAGAISGAGLNACTMYVLERRANGKEVLLGKMVIYLNI